MKNKTNIEELQLTLANIFSARNYIQKCFDILDSGSQQNKNLLKDFDDAFVKYLEKQKTQVTNLAFTCMQYSQ